MSSSVVPERQVLSLLRSGSPRTRRQIMRLLSKHEPEAVDAVIDDLVAKQHLMVTPRQILDVDLCAEAESITVDDVASKIHSS